MGSPLAADVALSDRHVNLLRVSGKNPKQEISKCEFHERGKYANIFRALRLISVIRVKN
jgi:hypothetical protein